MPGLTSYRVLICALPSIRLWSVFWIQIFTSNCHFGFYPSSAFSLIPKVDHIVSFSRHGFIPPRFLGSFGVLLRDQCWFQTTKILSRGTQLSQRAQVTETRQEIIKMSLVVHKWFFDTELYCGKGWQKILADSLTAETLISATQHRNRIKGRSFQYNR